jgi:hypothetical protein
MVRVRIRPDVLAGVSAEELLHHGSVTHRCDSTGRDGTGTSLFRPMAGLCLSISLSVGPLEEADRFAGVDVEGVEAFHLDHDELLHDLIVLRR